MVPPDGRVGGFRGNRPKLRGDAILKPRPAAAGPVPPVSAVTPPRAAKTRVLFVCIGNAIRSQMAEAFARVYGSDVIIPQSAGLTPANVIPPLTHKILAERNISLGQQFPKGLDMMRETFDLVVNLSGHPLPAVSGEVIEWPVPDPIGQKEEVYRQAAARIEGLVMQLILTLRTRK